MYIRDILQFSQKTCILITSEATFYFSFSWDYLWMEVFLGKTSKPKWYKKHSLQFESEPLTILVEEFYFTSITEQIPNTRGITSKSEGDEGWEVKEEACGYWSPW